MNCNTRFFLFSKLLSVLKPSNRNYGESAFPPFPLLLLLNDNITRKISGIEKGKQEIGKTRSKMCFRIPLLRPLHPHIEHGTIVNGAGAAAGPVALSVSILTAGVALACGVGYAVVNDVLETHHALFLGDSDVWRWAGDVVALNGIS